MVNYYQILGVETTATMVEVKAAFRRLALLYHPDRNEDAKAVEKFTMVQKAYEVLSNKDSRLHYDLQLQLKTVGLGGQPSQGPTLFITDRIWMKVSRKRVKPGETFSVIIRTYRRFNEPVLQGKEQFEQVNHYSQVIMIQERPMREVLYVFRTHREGVFSIGPARIRQGQYEYVSGSAEIEVNADAHPMVLPSKKAVVVLMVAFFTFLSFALTFDYFVRKERERVYQLRKLQQQAEQAEHSKALSVQSLKTGSSPYEEYYGKSAYDADIFHKVQVVNNFGIDAIVLLQNVDNGKIIRNHYLKGRDTLVMGEIPPGNYRIKAEVGVDWNRDLLSDGGKIKGNFSVPLVYIVMDKPEQEIKINAKNPGDSSNYHIFGFELFNPDKGGPTNRYVDDKTFFDQ